MRPAVASTTSRVTRLRSSSVSDGPSLALTGATMPCAPARTHQSTSRRSEASSTSPRSSNGVTGMVKTPRKPAICQAPSPCRRFPPDDRSVPRDAEDLPGEDQVRVVDLVPVSLEDARPERGVAVLAPGDARQGVARLHDVLRETAVAGDDGRPEDDRDDNLVQLAAVPLRRGLEDREEAVRGPGRAAEGERGVKIAQRPHLARHDRHLHQLVAILVADAGG